MEKPKPGTLVHDTDARLGVVVDDPMGICADDEIPVVFEGVEFYIRVSVFGVFVVGPEQAVADFRECGGGKEEECCIFLVAGPGGLECARFSSLRWHLIARAVAGDFSAQRRPVEMYPRCKLKEEKDEPGRGDSGSCKHTVEVVRNELEDAV